MRGDGDDGEDGLTDGPASVVGGDELDAGGKFVPKLLQTLALGIATRDAGDDDVVGPCLGLGQVVRPGAGRRVFPQSWHAVWRRSSGCWIRLRRVYGDEG